MDLSFILQEPAFFVQLDHIDRVIASTPPAGVPALFEALPPAVFMVLAATRPDCWPNLADWLPLLPPPDIQKGYVGFSGIEALSRSSTFVIEARHVYEKLTGKPIHSASILDYGVGWGRILRLFYQIVPTDQTFGLDAWPASLALVESLRLRSKLTLVSPLPSGPVLDRPIDLIWAFSVFTHLSEQAADAALKAIHSTLAPDGLAIITIRPRHTGVSTYPELLKTYDATGFAFMPAPGGQHYGNTIMSLDFFREHWPEWKVHAVTWDQDNFMQLKLYLTKAEFSWF